MPIRIADLKTHFLPDLFAWCRACTCWECPETFSSGRCTPEEARAKAEWFETMAGVFDPCAKLAYVDDKPVGYCQYAPPEHLPGILDYEELAAHVDRNAVFISCLHVSTEHQRKGLGRTLLQAVIDDLVSRGIKAVETFARNDSADGCSGPASFYLSQGFIVKATQDYPNGSSFSLVRLELGTQRGSCIM